MKSHNLIQTKGLLRGNRCKNVHFDPVFTHLVIKIVLIPNITMKKSPEFLIECKRRIVDTIFKFYVLLPLKTNFK